MKTTEARALSKYQVEDIREEIEARIEGYKLDRDQYWDDAKIMDSAARILEDRGDDPMVVLGGLNYNARHYRQEAAEITGIMNGLRQGLRVINSTLMVPPPEECFPDLTHADRCRLYLMRSFGDALPDLNEDYIQEAEHQDGEAYWNHFLTKDGHLDKDALALDMVLYALNLSTAKNPFEAVQAGKVRL